MQTIPDTVLNQIVAQWPHMATMVANLKQHPAMAQQIEKAITDEYLRGVVLLSGMDTWYLAQVAYGGPWGGTWVRSSMAAALLRVDESRIRQRCIAKTLPAIKYGKTWYVRRDAVEERVKP